MLIKSPKALHLGQEQPLSLPERKMSHLLSSANKLSGDGLCSMGKAGLSPSRASIQSTGLKEARNHSFPSSNLNPPVLSRYLTRNRSSMYVFTEAMMNGLLEFTFGSALPGSLCKKRKKEVRGANPLYSRKSAYNL